MISTVLITGGAGFVGCHLAESFLRQGSAVRVLDNLSRAGSEHNLQALQESGLPFDFIHGDVRNRAQMEAAVRGVDEIYHLAAQVAVTTSVEDPCTDLETNLLGTFNVLEAARTSASCSFLFFTSTNKVYGDLQHINVLEDADACRLADRDAVDENVPLDFHSPYGCSKGAAEQYVRDYARVYGLPTVVFRMSCIAGPRQFGNEDQGWLAHFIYSVIEGKPLTIYGDGKQVRDVLHVNDLVAAIHAARVHSAKTAGEIFNIGGGPRHAVSLRQMIPVIKAATVGRAEIRYEPPRVGDQRIFIADNAKFSAATGWQPSIPLAQTIDDILRWRLQNGALFVERAIEARKAG